MVNTDKIRIYPNHKKEWSEFCDASGLSSAELFKKLMESDKLKTREAMKKFSEEQLKEKLGRFKGGF